MGVSFIIYILPFDFKNTSLEESFKTFMFILIHIATPLILSFKCIKGAFLDIFVRILFCCSFFVFFSVLLCASKCLMISSVIQVAICFLCYIKLIFLHIKRVLIFLLTKKKKASIYLLKTFPEELVFKGFCC